MNAISNAEFAKRMLLLSRAADAFEPTATYDPDGDCIEFLAAPDPFRAERIDELVTVYYSQETGLVVGSQLKNVSHFCQEMLTKWPGFRIEIHDGRVMLVHIFRTKLWSSHLNPQELPALVYQKLIALAASTEVEVEAEEMCLSQSAD